MTGDGFGWRWEWEWHHHRKMLIKERSWQPDEHHQVPSGHSLESYDFDLAMYHYYYDDDAGRVFIFGSRAISVLGAEYQVARG